MGSDLPHLAYLSVAGCGDLGKGITDIDQQDSRSASG